jgi:hypothetical protein
MLVAPGTLSPIIGRSCRCSVSRNGPVPVRLVGVENVTRDRGAKRPAAEHDHVKRPRIVLRAAVRTTGIAIGVA